MSSQHPTIADPTLLGTRSAASLSLVVYIDRGDGGIATHVVQLADGVDVTIGRSRDCVITVDSERVSRHHARLWLAGDQVMVEDLGSRNGTRISGELIAAASPLALGAELSIRPLSATLTTSGALRWRRQLGGDTLEQRVDREVDRGRRYKRLFALAMIRIEGSDESIDEAIDRAIARVRGMDEVFEYGPNELAVLLPELDTAAAEVATRRITSAARGTSSVVVRAGVAGFPDHASGGDELIDRARAALRSARENRVQTALGTSAEVAPISAAVCEAPATRHLFDLLGRVATSNVTVLILGETGAGKEVSAATIHAASNRASGPFIKLNCACLPATLLESELFGHERGAFTGADRQKIGYFEAASGGTLFLDELGEIEPALQTKLLRVLESRTIIRVGGTAEIPVDVRLICATNRDLETEVAEDRFRADLYYRISGFTVVVPPLRERAADIEPLAARFLTEIARELKIRKPAITTDALAALRGYAWPGNVRELRNVIERAAVIAAGADIELSHLPETLAAGHRVAVIAGRQPASAGSRDRLAEVERAAIVEALEAHGNNQTHAAKHLGITRRALIYRMEKYGIKPKPRSTR